MLRRQWAETVAQGSATWNREGHDQRTQFPRRPDLSHEQVAELAGHLRAVLAQIDAGHLDATPTMRARIEGALTALDAIDHRS